MGSEARTRLALAGLLAVTLFSFSQLFADRDYPGPAALGMLLAAGIAILARRFGISSLLTALASLVAMITYIAFIFQTSNTFFGLPTPGAVRGLVDAVRHAIDRSQVDFAPVPVRPGYVIMVVGGLWIAAALGEIATFRWRKPLIASVTPVVLFSVVMVLGSDAGTPLYVALFLAALLAYWGIESSHRLRSWGRWVPTWAGHEAEEEPDSITGEIARKMGATCVAIALIAPIFLPALGDGLLSWRNPVTGSGPGLGGGGGGDGGGRIDPLVSIAPTLINQSDTELFRVQSELATYWRLITLPEFDGATWRPSGGDLEVIEDGEIDGPVPVSTASQTLEQRITISGLVSDSLPAAVQPTDITLVTQQNLEEDLRYDPESGDIRTTSELGGSLVYQVTSQIPEESYTELANAQIGDPGEPGDDVFTELPDELTPEVKALAAGWVQDANTDFEKLVALQNHFRSDEFTYSINPDEIRADQAASTDDLTNFLINSKTGYCQQFSTAFAVLARHLGYPSRLVVGFLPGEASGEGDDENVVRGTDAHSWPEVYFDHIGWVAFEPTPRRDSTRVAAAPFYTNPAAPGTDGVLGNDGQNSQQPNGGQPDDPRHGDAGDDPSGGGLSADELQNLINQGGETTGGGLEGTQPWERTFGRLVVVLLVAALFFILSIPGLKERRIRKAYSSAHGGRDLASAAFLDFSLNARELVTLRGPGESPMSYAVRVAEMKGIPERPAVRLAAIYEAAEYSARDVSDQDAGEARKLAKGLRKNMWSRSSMWQRAVRLFSPRNLSLGFPNLRPRFSGRRAAA